MAELFQVFGPPGTGKTTYLAGQIERAVSAYGQQRVMICSYTKAAAAVIASRVDMPRENVGTLHSFCFRALGGPELTVGKEKDFNGAFPRWKLSAGDTDVDDPYKDMSERETLGDALLARADVLRARMVPVEIWPAQVRQFYHDWSTWKSAMALMDYTDLLEVALRDCESAPGRPLVGFVDETQDCSKLQMKVIEQWAGPMSKCVLAGDDDQVLFSWAGASPDAFLGLTVPDGNKRFLEQSYRVPKAVHALANEWVQRLTHRQPKRYLPRDAEGEVRQTSGNFKQPELLIRDAQKYLAAGKSVMFLASCAYMLDPLKAVLQRECISFWNPYRRKRGDWNPLATGGSRTNPVDRVLSFLRIDPATWGAEARAWTENEFRRWMECWQSRGRLLPGAKQWLENMKGSDKKFDLAELDDWLEPEAINEFWKHTAVLDKPEQVAAALHWWLKHCLKERAEKLAYPVGIAARHGGAALRKPPQVILGTVHSVKGGEADVCYLCPDLSQAAMREWVGTNEDQDAIKRLFYVGMTRPRETLVLCQASGCTSVNLAI